MKSTTRAFTLHATRAGPHVGTSKRGRTRTMQRPTARRRPRRCVAVAPVRSAHRTQSRRVPVLVAVRFYSFCTDRQTDSLTLSSRLLPEQATSYKLYGTRIR